MSFNAKNYVNNDMLECLRKAFTLKNLEVVPTNIVINVQKLTTTEPNTQDSPFIELATEMISKIDRNITLK